MFVARYKKSDFWLETELHVETDVHMDRLGKIPRWMSYISYFDQESSSRTTENADLSFSAYYTYENEARKVPIGTKSRRISVAVSCHLSATEERTKNKLLLVYTCEKDTHEDNTKETFRAR